MATTNIRIHRAQRDDEHPYYVAARATSQNKAISYEALGMLHYILSKPDDWEIQPKDLMREGCGKNKVYVILKELMEAKYVIRTYRRDEKGRVSEVDYQVYETPFHENQEMDNQEMVSSPNETPFPENPEMDNPEMENGDITYKRIDRVESERAHKAAKSKGLTPSKALKTPDTQKRALIDAWTQAMNFDGLGIGAGYYTTRRMAVAARMLKWERPATPEEITGYLITRKNKPDDYEFTWLEDDLCKHRVATAKPKIIAFGYTPDQQDEYLRLYRLQMGLEDAS